MISPQSMLFFPKKNRDIYNKFLRNPSKSKFLELIKKGLIPRPHYALGLILSAEQAINLGYKSIKVIELGCFNFDGIIDLEHYASDIKKFINIDIQIYGFTLKSGLPKTNQNSFDRLYRWSPDEFGYSKKQNYKNIKKSKIYFGNIKDTIPKFKKDIKKKITESPIGFIIFDLDFYTSTKKALSLLKMNENSYIPRPYLYFDDHSFSSKYEGERKAIMEFNSKEKNKISDIGEFAEQLSILWSKWIYLGKRFKQICFFKHKKFNMRIKDILEHDYYKDY